MEAIIHTEGGSDSGVFFFYEFAQELRIKSQSKKTNQQNISLMITAGLMKFCSFLVLLDI